MCDQCDYLAADLSTLNNHINSLHEGKPSIHNTEKYLNPAMAEKNLIITQLYLMISKS